MSISSEYDCIEKRETGVPYDNTAEPQERQSNQQDLVMAMSSPGSNSVSSLSSQGSLEDENDRLVELTEEISSLLPLLQRLPGLRLVDGLYFHYGDVSKEVIEDLCAFSRTIGSFILTDDGKSAEYPIHPGTLLRLQYFHTRFADAPLFPSMRHLRLEASNSSLHYLDFFISSPLKSLEIISVAVPYQTSVAVFLENALERGANLSNITLGPEPITETLLQACLKFDHLQKPEIKDSLPALDYALLKQFGGLPQREALVLNAEACQYESSNLPSAQEPGTVQGVEDGHFESPPCNGDRYDGHPEPPRASSGGCDAKPEWPSDRLPEPGLTPRTHSPRPFDTCPTPTRPQEEGLTDLDNPKNVTDPEAFIPVSIVPEPSHEPPNYFSHLKKLHVVGKVALIEDILAMVSSQEIADISLSLVLVEAAPRPPIKRSIMAKKKKKSISSEEVQVSIAAPPSPSERFFKVLEGGLSKWSPTITEVLIGNAGASLFSDSTLVELPSSVFHALLLSNSLKKLDIRGWTLLTFSENFQGLSSLHEPTS